TKTSDMILPLIGAYAEFQARGWEDIPLISVRGDDVNAGGKGDQQPYWDTDEYVYAKDYWMYGSVWENFYRDIFTCHVAMEQIEKYKEFAPNPALADQYIAEARTLRAFMLFQLARVWGALLVPESSDPSEIYQSPIATREQVLQHISDEMTAVAPLLPAVRPNERTDIPGGVTRYTALAIKALANLELENYQAVADATSEIISSNKFSLYPDFYQLFKKPGKLSNESLLELQYSDYNQGSGTAHNYLNAFFGPENWTPAVPGSGSGWGFFEPSLKYIKFMLDRGETIRLETSVIFTNRGIAELTSDPNYASLPGWISNTTRDGDRFNDFNRAMFSSGKH